MATPVLDSVTAGGQSASATTTLPHTIRQRDKRLLQVKIASRSTATVATLTWNGTSVVARRYIGASVS